MKIHRRIGACIAMVSLSICSGLLVNGASLTNAAVPSNPRDERPEQTENISSNWIELIQKLPKNEDTKAKLLNGIINSVDYFQTAKGEFRTNLLGMGETTVKYVTNIDSQRSYQRISGDSLDLEQYFKDAVFTTYDNRAKTVRIVSSMLPVDNRLLSYEPNTSVYGIADPQRSFIDNRIHSGQDGVKEYRYRYDLTNTGIASTSLFSQELAFNFLADLNSWELVGGDVFLGRNCFMLQGMPSAYANDKLQIHQFTLYVDAQTGIILKLQGYSQQGEMTQYLITTRIAIDASDVDRLLQEADEANTAYSDYQSE